MNVQPWSQGWDFDYFDRHTMWPVIWDEILESYFYAKNPKKQQKTKNAKNKGRGTGRVGAQDRQVNRDTNRRNEEKIKTTSNLFHLNYTGESTLKKIINNHNK